MEAVTAIYPGSFDPVTNGHLDLIERGTKIFTRLVVAVLRNTEKNPLFTLSERVEMMQEATRAFPNVEVDAFDGLLVDYARKLGAHILLRGIRAVSDYEFELQMAMMNRKLEPQTRNRLHAAGRSLQLSELASGARNCAARRTVTGLVPPAVEQRLRAKVT